jgi:putative restriction endonuclease
LLVLGNFGSFDPELQKQHISGLTYAGKLDAEIWDEFNSDWNRLVLEANRLRAEFGGDVELRDEVDADISLPHGASEKDALRKTRIHQAFFRDAILSSYEGTCCITGLRIPECLVAATLSHGVSPKSIERIPQWSMLDRLTALTGADHGR